MNSARGWFYSCLVVASVQTSCGKPPPPKESAPPTDATTSAAPKASPKPTTAAKAKAQEPLASTDIIAKAREPDFVKRLQGFVLHDTCIKDTLSPATLAGMPEGGKLMPDGLPPASINLPSSEAFNSLAVWLEGMKHPEDSRLLFARLYAQERQSGWAAFCVDSSPAIRSSDLRIPKNAPAGKASVAFTDEGEKRLGAIPASKSYLIMVLDDAHVLLTVPTAGLRTTKAPVLTFDFK